MIRIDVSSNIKDVTRGLDDFARRQFHIAINAAMQTAR